MNDSGAPQVVPATSWLHRTPVSAKLTTVMVVFVGIIAAMVVVGGGSLKVSNALRSYVAGEGLWSRGQKDAVFALERYADSHDPADFAAYERAVGVTLGDRQARLELEKPDYDADVVTRGFAQGGNHPADIPGMIFLFRWFRHVSYLDQAIATWAEGDATIDRLQAQAVALKRAVAAGAAPVQVDAVVADIRRVNDDAAVLELRFSATLAAGARWIRELLVLGGLAVTAVLLFIGLLLARRVGAQIRTAIGELQLGTARVAAGDFAHPIAVTSGDELGALARAFNFMSEQRRRADEALGERLQFERLVARLSSELTTLAPAQVDTGINRALGDLGAFANVDRCYVFWFNDTQTTVNCSNEWCAPGVPPQIARLKNLRVADYPWVESQLQRGQIVHVPRLADLPPAADAERREWEAEAIRSLLLVPMQAGAAVRGYVGFDSVRAEKAWPQEAQDLLRIFGEILVNTGLRVKAELALRERNEKLAAAVQDLERSNAELEEFAHAASHDLKTPLRAINGFVQLLQRKLKGQLDAEGEEYISLTLNAVDQMHALIAGVLAMSHIGKGDTEFVLTDCEAVLNDVLGQYAPLIAERHVAVTHDRLPAVVATRVEIQQLLQNLIGNAIKFQPGPEPRVHVGVAREGGFWKFWVRDYGIGIGPEYFQKIFQIFQRLHTADDYEGSGIGLSICRKVVQRHGGRIWVESEPGKGATFFFTLQA